jgi:type IV pilus assembly protein PilN
MIKINLLAEAKPAKKKRGVAALGAAGRLNVLLLFGVLAIGLLAILVQWWVLRSRIKEMDEKIRVAQAEVTRLESVLKEVKDFEDKKARLQRKVDLINQLKANQKGPVRLMDEVSRALPDLLWIERMEYKGSFIGLEGKALNPNAVANFLENLKRVSAFQEPKVEKIQAASGSGGTALYSFRLSFTFSNIDKTLTPEAGGGAGKAEPAPAPSGPPKADRSPARAGGEADRGA